MLLQKTDGTARGVGIRAETGITLMKLRVRECPEWDVIAAGDAPQLLQRCVGRGGNDGNVATLFIEVDVCLPLYISVSQNRRFS